MSTKPTLRPVPTDDRVWLVTALADALRGGIPVLPLAPELAADGDATARLVAEINGSPLPEGTAVLVRTSGSSGVPKTVALSADALIQSAEATHEALGGPGQWLVTLPAHLISGLQMLVRSHVSGIDPVFYDGPFDPAALLAAAERMPHERRYVSLVPVQFARLLYLAERDEAAADILRGFAGVLVGGQAISLDLRRRAHALGVALRRSYGMTETAGGCVYDGVEIGDTRVRIRGGEVQLAGPSLALGYVGDAALTRERFIEDGVTRWYRTGDAGELLGGMLTVTGRLDRVIISGGVNVSLDEVERVVREQPGWASAVALPVSDPEWGERVSLVRESGSADREDAGREDAGREDARSEDLGGESGGVPVDAEDAGRELDGAEGDGGALGAALGFDGLRELLRAQLGAAAVPVWVNEIAELPRLAGGKPDLVEIERWVTELRASFRQLGATRADSGPAAAPETDPQRDQ